MNVKLWWEESILWLNIKKFVQIDTEHDITWRRFKWFETYIWCENWSLCKNLLYEANDEGRIKTIFKIKLIKEQNKIWIASCIGNLESKIFKSKNLWIVNAIQLLKNEDISICNHEARDLRNNHLIKGGSIKIINFLDNEEIIKSAKSKKLKKYYFWNKY